MTKRTAQTSAVCAVLFVMPYLECRAAFCMCELPAHLDEELVVQCCRLMGEAPHGGQLPETVNGSAALEGDVSAVLCRTREQEGTRRIDIAEGAAPRIHGAHHDGQEYAAVEDGEDDVAPPCEHPRRAWRRMRRISLSSRHARHERTYVVAARRVMFPRAP